MKTLFYMPLLLVVLLGSCKKDFLEERSNKRLFVPSTLEDYQNMLDNTEVFAMGVYPAVTQNLSDDFYMLDNAWNSLVLREKNAYIWNSQPDETDGNWALAYRQVFYANVTLDGLEQMDADQKSQVLWSQLRGTALFYRAFAFYNLAQLFTRPYLIQNAGDEPGIPLRLVADADKNYPRGTVKQTYQQILKDLREAAVLLPEKTSYKTRPGVMAAYALLARVNLAIGDYTAAEQHADRALAVSDFLLNYADISAIPRRPFPLALPNANPEVIWYCSMLGSFMRSTSTFADTVLYASYAAQDKRKTLFFSSSNGKQATFKGSYSGDTYYFTGLATDELYLIKAECLARGGAGTEAMKWLNKLLEKRWSAGQFTPLTAASAEEALRIVLVERRKELIGRGMRWMDLRRLNQDPKFTLVQTRRLQGKTYTLEPLDLGRYLLPIPMQEIQLTGIVQN